MRTPLSPTKTNKKITSTHLTVCYCDERVQEKHARSQPRFILHASNDTSSSALQTLQLRAALPVKQANRPARQLETSGRPSVKARSADRPDDRQGSQPPASARPAHFRAHLRGGCLSAESQLTARADWLIGFPDASTARPTRRSRHSTIRLAGPGARTSRSALFLCAPRGQTTASSTEAAIDMTTSPGAAY